MAETKFQYTLSEIQKAAQWLIKQCKGQSQIWCFEGDMGAGKTTLIAAIMLELGVKETVSSPTFSLVNEYEANLQTPIFHFDFYRIKSSEEAYDMGIEEYLDSGNLCLIEWPSQISDILSDTTRTIIHIQHHGEGRQMELSHIVK